MKIYLVLLAFVLVGCAVFSAADQEPEERNDDKDNVVQAPPSPVYLKMKISGSVNTNRRYCYCFQLYCKVPGMRNGFLGWITTYSSGYVAINNVLYRFHRCNVNKS